MHHTAGIPEMKDDLRIAIGHHCKSGLFRAGVARIVPKTFYHIPQYFGRRKFLVLHDGKVAIFRGTENCDSFVYTVNTPVAIQQLCTHIGKFISFPANKTSLLESFFDHRSYAKKELLLAEGQRCFEKFFIVKGCVQLSYLRQNGAEQILDFALENWWISDFMAFAHGGIAQFSIRAVEHTEVLCISASGQQALLEQVPELNAYFHLVFQRAFAAYQMRLRYLYEFSKEELYLHFLQHFPAFTQRVPQYLLASFLGFTPVYLSELRKKFAS